MRAAARKKKAPRKKRPRKAPKKTAGNHRAEEPTRERIHSWEKAVSCAYLRFMRWRLPRKKVAKAVGVGERTLQRWESCPWWPEAQAEAMSRWCGGLISASCNTVLTAAEIGDAQTARWALERLMPIMTPPAQRHEHGGKDGAAAIRTEVVFVNPDDEG